MNTIYSDGTYLDNNPNWHQEDSPWKAGHIANVLRRQGIRPSTICEIGCGAGEIVCSLAREFGDGVKFSGYDISPQAFEICGKKQGKNVRFFQMNLLDEDIRFDVVLAIDVFEHVEDYFGFLRKLRSKGEYKIFHIPLDLSVQSVLRGSPIMKKRASVGHLHYFTEETALATLRDTGYEVLSHCFTSGALELPQRSWKARLMKLPRKLLFSLNPTLAVRLLGGFSLLVLAK